MSERHEKRHREHPELPVHTMVTYLPKPGKEAELLELVKKHEPALRKIGLAGPDPFKLWKAYDIRKNRYAFVELMAWKDGNASEIAHQSPEVMAVWEPMGPVLEELTICEVEQL